MSRTRSLTPVATARRRSARVAAALTVLAVAAGAIGAGALTASSASAAETLPSSFAGSGTSWKYSDNNTDPAAGNPDRLVWTTGAFSDAAWKTGVGPFGAKNGSATPNLGSAFPVTTVLTQYVDPTAATKVDIPTFHFRTGIDITAGQLSQVESLTGSITYDDAVQIFVNGTKVAGFVDSRVEAVPDAQKNLTYAGNSGGDPVSSTFSIPASALHAGTNTLAVALYQDRSSSSDAYLVLKSLTPVIAVPAGYSGITTAAGADRSERVVSWTTSADRAQSVQFAPSAEVTGDTFPATAGVIAATGSTTGGVFTRTATLTGLALETAYSYRVGVDGNWSPVGTFTTPAADGHTEQVQVTVPQAAPGEFVWSIDGTNGLVDFGTAVQTGDHFAATGSMNPIRVTDTRRAAPVWSISAQVGDFTSASTSFSGKYLGWTPTVVEAGGDAVAGATVASGFDSGTGLTAAATLGSAAAGHAAGSAKLGAALELKLPVEVSDGTYQATLTLTALS